MHAAKLIIILLSCVWISVPVIAQERPIETARVYGFGDDDTTFSVWRSPYEFGQRTYLLKYKDIDEVWTLAEELGARGDVIYRNDAGRIVLRENGIGSATLYPDPQSKGIPVWRRETEIVYLRVPTPTENDVKEYATVEEWSRAYAYAGNTREEVTSPRKKASNHQADKRIEFDNWPSTHASYQIDINSHLRTFLDKHPDSALDKIIVKIGDQPSLLHEEARLTIWVNPELGYAGRPSTERMLREIKTEDG